MIFVSRRNSPATVIHRLHPFSKMAAGMGLSALALCLHSPAALAVLLGFVFTYRQQPASVRPCGNCFRCWPFSRCSAQ
ncbi:MAG: hypothetical protein D3907_15915 [Candidatus Electrothrix sp. AUS3]|nr:hypothetical protein [Candidatus Electrothrix gigas]